jgi:hypothetical protein
MTQAPRSSSPEESVFRLLLPASDRPSSEAASIDVAGQRWQVANFGEVPPSVQAPEYTCVSYSWGAEREPSPWDGERLMSSRVMPTFSTAIAALRPRPSAIWLDAACMPPSDPARSLCLQSMGAIYAAASNVVAVLSPAASTLLDKVRRGEAVGIEELQQLEADDWVSRVWTYQEMANSQSISFLAEGGTGDPVNASRLFNAVGQALTQYRKVEQVDAYEFRGRHPRVDALETLSDDWLGASSGNRSAYQVTTAMEGRIAVCAEDYFYAMIGAITSAPSSDPNDAAVSPSEYFMRVCEEKGDFSFVYSSAPRSSDDGRSWRPRPDRLPPIVPWPSTGAMQTGELHSALLHLHNMTRVTFGQLDEKARIFITAWLEKTVRSPLPSQMGDAVRETLRRAGFTGCGEYLETVDGLFFPQHSPADTSDSEVFVATDIFFNFGAPGLLLNKAESGMARFRDVGVFVGKVPRARETIICT